MGSVCLLSVRLMPIMPWVPLRLVFRVDSSTNILYCCMLCCVLSNFRFWHGFSLCQWGVINLDLHHCDPLEHTYGRHMCLLVLVHGPYWSELSSCSSHCFQLGVPCATQTAVPQLFSPYGGANSLVVLAESLSFSVFPVCLLHAQKRLCLIFVAHLQQGSLSLALELRWQESSGHQAGSSADSKKGVHLDGISDVIQSTISITSSSSVVKVGSLPQFWITEKDNAQICYASCG